MSDFIRSRTTSYADGMSLFVVVRAIARVCAVELTRRREGMMCARGSGVIFDAVALVLTWKSIKRVTRANSQAAVHEASHRSGSSAGYGTLSLVLMRDSTNVLF